MNYNVIVTLLILLGVAGIGLAIRTWIKSAVERSVEKRFVREMEEVRSDLRLKESKIAALQSSVVGGHSERRSILDRRRLGAAENLWAATLRLDKFRHLVEFVQRIDFSKADQKAKTDPKTREFLTMVSGPEDITSAIEAIGGEAERPFLPSEVWDIFEAYRSVLFHCFLQLKLSAAGIGDTDKLMDAKKLSESVKKAMPHLSEYLDKHGAKGAVAVAEPLRDLLLEAIRGTLHSEPSEAGNLSQIVKTFEDLDAAIGRSAGKQKGVNKTPHAR